MQRGAQVVAQPFLATGLQPPGHFVGTDLGNKGARAGVETRVIAAGVEGEHVNVVGEKRMIDGVGPVAVITVNALDVEQDRHVGVQALDVVIERLGVISQGLAPEAHPFLQHGIV